MSTATKAKHAPQTFDSINEAFDYCRRKDHPVVVVMDDASQGYMGTYKLYPSGKADQLLRCLCMSLDNHTLCPTHGEKEFVNWEAEKRAQLIKAAPQMLQALEFVLAEQWEHRCSDKVGGCTAVSSQALLRAEAAIKLAKGESL